ncbi:hypothetical protein CON63_02270 [Bacillus toyonensis]|nr:hypothetical protein CON63_02270 [Bacillus toyonensis]PEW96604.1 hypothetical protein CN446_17550 [Bacillus cereus]
MGEISSSSICRFKTKNNLYLQKNKVKFVDSFFEKHFIDMSFRMLFHSHFIERKRLSCLKVIVKKRKNLYIYLVSYFET